MAARRRDGTRAPLHHSPQQLTCDVQEAQPLSLQGRPRGQLFPFPLHRLHHSRLTLPRRLHPGTSGRSLRTRGVPGRESGFCQSRLDPSRRLANRRVGVPERRGESRLDTPRASGVALGWRFNLDSVLSEAGNQTRNLISYGICASILIGH